METQVIALYNPPAENKQRGHDVDKQRHFQHLITHSENYTMHKIEESDLTYCWYNVKRKPFYFSFMI